MDPGGGRGGGNNRLGGSPPFVGLYHFPLFDLVPTFAGVTHAATINGTAKKSLWPAQVASNPLNGMYAVPLSASSGGATRSTMQTITFTILIKVSVPGVRDGIAPGALQQENIVKVIAGVAVGITLHTMSVRGNVPVGCAIRPLSIDEVVPWGESGGLKSSAPEPLRDLGGAGNPGAVRAKRGVKLDSL